MHPSSIALEIEKLRESPSNIRELPSAHRLGGTILGKTAKKLLEDFAAERATIFPDKVLEHWLMSAGLCSPRASTDIIHWVTESQYRRSIQSSPQSRLDVFLRDAGLVYELAKWVAAARGDGIPDAIHDSFPGLDAKVMTFREGEVERAKTWLQNWLSENVEAYAKICDPYFGLEQLEFLVHIPPNCKVLIVTTDRHLNLDDGLECFRQDLERHWNRLTSRSLLDAQFLIVPRKLDDRFHDRAIITLHSGLDIGPSLNGLGKSFQKITILSEEDAKNLEQSYIDQLLNNATWFMEGVHPVVVFWKA
jgi:hypothetical protein